VRAKRRSPSQRPLLRPAFLADEFDPDLAFRRLDAVGGAALAAPGLDPGIALFNRNHLAFQRLAHKPLGFLAHLLLRHVGPFFWSPRLRRCLYSRVVALG
jgi:hypothetical protein